MSYIKALRLDGNGEWQPRPVQDVPIPAAGDWEPTPYAASALERECANVRGAPEGTRNSTLNNAALAMGKHIAGGGISAEQARAALFDAAMACGLEQVEASRTIRSGFAKGVQEPKVGRGREQVTLTTLPAQREGQTSERSSWEHIDPETAALLTEQPPCHLAREDGTFLFYPGKVNGLIGESESGKTWVALLAVKQALDDHVPVLYLDFEDTYSGITGRLTSMHADLTTFYYTAPDVNLDANHKAALFADLEQIQPALIVLDGFNAAMTLMGLDLNSNTEATRFSQELLRPLANTGACVVYVDHLPKNREAQGRGGIGAQAKRAMTTGCAIRVDVEQEFGKGQTGRLKLTVDKDRAGLVRAIGGGSKHLGHAVLTSSPLGDAVHLAIDPDGGSKPTVLMGRVLAYLDMVGEASKTQIKDNVEGNNDHIWRAIEVLHNDGKVHIRPGKNRSLIVTASVVPSHETSSRDDSPIVPPRIKGGTTGATEDPTPDTNLRWDQR